VGLPADGLHASSGQIHPFSSAEALFPGPSLRSSEPAFDLDLSRLEQQYKALQRRLHPDKFATASAQEQEYAAQQATAVNQAYDVLKRPLRRASYIVRPFTAASVQLPA
jgi:glutathione S-transferase